MRAAASRPPGRRSGPACETENTEKEVDLLCFMKT